MKRKILKEEFIKTIYDWVVEKYPFVTVKIINKGSKIGLQMCEAMCEKYPIIDLDKYFKEYQKNNDMDAVLKQIQESYEQNRILQKAASENERAVDQREYGER